MNGKTENKVFVNLSDVFIEKNNFRFFRCYYSFFVFYGV